MENVNVLILGATGSLGQALVAYFDRPPFRVAGVGRDPLRLKALAERHPNGVFYQFDILNLRAFVDEIGSFLKVAPFHWLIHAAAAKHVDLAEKEGLEEALRTNIMGTYALASLVPALGVERALFISTDKAVEPVTFYGLTKAVAERVWLNRGPEFRVLRYGNVLNARGGVLSIWQGRKQKGKPIVVRRPVPTRFALTLADAVRLVHDALTVVAAERLFVPREPWAVDILDLARAMGGDVEMGTLLPTEKQHEVLISAVEQVKPTMKPSLAAVVPGREQEGRRLYHSGLTPNRWQGAMLKVIANLTPTSNVHLLPAYREE